MTQVPIVRSVSAARTTGQLSRRPSRGSPAPAGGVEGSPVTTMVSARKNSTTYIARQLANCTLAPASSGAENRPQDCIAWYVPSALPSSSSGVISLRMTWSSGDVKALASAAAIKATTNSHHFGESASTTAASVITPNAQRTTLAGSRLRTR